MEELIRLLIEPLVTDIKTVKIEKVNLDGNVHFTVSVPKADIAKVIGKEGKMVKAIKNLTKIRAIKENVYCSLEIVEA
ncbi:KH domain-containing protein [Candidatus Curtissbacteria bacterium]|nr:KH domain-containing protein [Candidatus Curtissbacteria bacterium]